jgi:hypothetical protein
LSGLKEIGIDTMVRPIYETKEDLRNENSVINYFCSYFNSNFSFHKIPKQYHLDYCITNKNKVKYFCEVKVRKNSSYQYSDYLLSLAKVSAAKNLQDASGLKSILLVKWTDKIGYTKFNFDWPVYIGGRKDRDDWQDVEPVVHIPNNSFKFLE